MWEFHRTHCQTLSISFALFSFWNKVDSPIVSGPLALSLRKRLPIGTSSTVFRAAGGKKIRKVSVKLTTQQQSLSREADTSKHLSLSAFSCFGFYVFYRKSSPASLENFSHTDTLSIRLDPLQHLFQERLCYSPTGLAQHWQYGTWSKL